MGLGVIRDLASRRPLWVIGSWLIVAAVVGVLSPDLTRLAAEGQARMLAGGAESRRAAELVRQCWPDQAYESMVVAVLHRPGGLTDADRRFAARLARRFEAAERPDEVLRVIGPGVGARDRPSGWSARTARSRWWPCRSRRRSSRRSRTRPSPGARRQAADARRRIPPGLEVRWTGDAVIGRDYMASVKTSLDRAAVATVVLLLVVLLCVYRSFWLALVPLVTIGISLVIARGLLAWMILAGWEVSSLVELFLVAILFGTGTDFCLFLSWRFAEHFNPNNPAGSMRVTLARSFAALVTSAGTIIIGLLLMGTTRFKLFSSTGPSVAMGLAIALLATLSLTPALLIAAGPHPSAGLRRPGRRAPTAFWDRLGSAAMARPLRSWAVHGAGDAPAGDPGAADRVHPGPVDRAAGADAVGRGLPAGGLEVRPGDAGPADRGARVGRRLPQVGGPGPDRRREPAACRTSGGSTEVRSATQPLGSPQPFVAPGWRRGWARSTPASSSFPRAPTSSARG